MINSLLVMKMNEAFEYHFDADDLHLKYRKGPRPASWREFHDYDEIVLFLGGDATLVSKDIQLKLSPGNITLVPKETFHQFVVRDIENYSRFILGFKETPELSSLIREVMTEIKVIKNPSETISSVFKFVIKAMKENIPDNEKHLLIRSALIQFLIELKNFSGEIAKTEIVLSPLTRLALSYIDMNFSKKLTLSSLAKEFNTSTSSLSHHFNKDLNLSVYQYITRRRLSEARKCIEKGLSLTEAAASCGFSDYSSFFRLYKTNYGKKPSELLK